MTEVVGFYINPNSENPHAAVEVALFLTNQEISQRFSDEARFVPARWDVALENPMLEVFREVAWTGYPIRQVPEVANYWEPFHDMFFRVLLEGAPPEEALARACEIMNEANRR